MPGAVVKSSDPPGVSLSFANNFWGKDDAGVPPLLERMHNAKLCCDELKTFYNIRAAIEEEYARKLLALSRKPLGSRETGSLRASLDTVKAETEALGKTHGAIAAQMKSELEEPLVAFAGGMKERRKIVQTGIEKLLKVKMQQTQAVNKTRDRFEQDCLRVKGYLAQGHMVMGQEERKNKAKLEKTQAQLAQNSHEYENAVKTLEDTSGKWVKEWKVACDKFQDLEEERLDFTRSCLWNYANIASTACVSDDASCEKIRVALEECEVEKDIHTFIKEKGTGHEIPDPPKFVNFSRSDSLDDDEHSDAGSADDPGYSVAQFHRPIHSESSPAADAAKDDKDDPIGPSMSELSTGPGSGSPRKGAPADSAISRRDVRRAGRVPPGRPPGAAGGSRALPPGQTPAPLDIRRPRQMVSDGMDSPIDKQSTSPTKKSPVNTDPIPAPASSSTPISPSIPSPSLPPPASSPQTKHPPLEPQRKGIFGGNSPFRRRSKHDKDRGSAPAVGGAAAAARSPTTQTQTQIQTRSPWNRPPPPGTRPLKGQSPITARRNTHDRHRSAPVAPAIAPPGPGLDDGTNSPLASNVGAAAAGPNEPVDPRANFQLNIGNNVFDVASPDQQLNQQQQQRGGGRQQQKQGSTVPTPGDPAVDPIAQALAELKGIGSAGTFSSSAIGVNGSANLAIGTGSAISRVSADQYVGLGANSSAAAASATGAGAGAVGDNAILPPPPLAAARPGAGHSGTPPPAYDATPSSVSAPVVSTVQHQHQQPLAPVRRLDAPQPAFTSAQMQRTTQKYAGRTQGVFNRPLVSNGGPPGGNGSAGRGTSPVPLQRSSRRRDASPGQASMRSGTSRRSVSPGPPGPRDAAAAAAAYHSSSTNSRHRYSQQNMPSNVPPANNNGPPRSLSYSPLPHQGGAQQGSGSRYARHVSPGTSPSSSAALQRGGAPPASPRAYPSRVSPAGQGTIRGHPSQQQQQQQHPARGSYGRPLSDQIIRHDSGAAASAYSRPATRQSAYYDARDPSPGGAAGYGRPSSSTGMELQLSPRVRGSGDGFDEYGAAVAAPVDEGYGSQRSYPYGSASDVRSVSRGSSYGGAAGGGGSARGRDRSGSRVMDGVSSDGRPILHYARALYPYVPAIPEEIGFARGDVLAILLHQDDGWWFAEMPDKPGYQGLVPSNYLAPIN